MTTINHSVLAGVAAVVTGNMSVMTKVVTLMLLAVSHLLLDAIPHYHFYEFKRLRETWKGAVVELGGGFILVPLLVWLSFSVDPFWLALCTFAASAFDFLVAAKIGIIARLNHWAHWWYRFFNPIAGVVCEVVFFLTLTVIFVKTT